MSPHVVIVIGIFVGFVFSIIAHEVAHGWVALKCGDPTAKFAGRISANPLVHIDPFMSILVPLITFVALGSPFGAAKAVPVNWKNLRHWKRDMILVSLAGVTVNILIAIACSLLYHLLALANPQIAITYTGQILIGIALTNVLLFVFNLIPIPPLDGSRVFRFLLPWEKRNAYDRLEQYGFIILIVLMQLPVTGMLFSLLTQLVARVLFLPIG